MSASYRFIPPPVSYTDADYVTARSRLILLAMSAWPDMDFESAAELVTLMLEADAWALDNLTYYVRNLGRESRFATAQQRQNLVNIARMNGYRPRGAVAAQWIQSFILGTPPAAAVTIPAGTIVRTGDVVAPIRFQLLAPVVIAAAQTAGTGVVEHSSAQSEAFTSTGLPNQRVKLGKTPYLDGSLVIVAGNGTFVEVRHLLDSTASDLHFETVTDQFDRCTVIFGNGRSGAVPLGDMVATYKTGGGDAGNISAAQATLVEGNFTDANGIPVRVATSNTTRTLKGVPRESVEEIRVNAPASVTSGGPRTVTETDFEVHAVAVVAGLARALCLTKARDVAVDENTANLYLVPEDGSPPSQAMKDATLGLFVQTAGQPDLAYPCLQTLRVNVYSALFLTVDGQVKVYRRAGFTAATVVANLQAAWAAFFAIRDAKRVLNPLINFGYYIQDKDGLPTLTLAWSDIFNALRDAAGVLKLSADADDLLLNGARQDVAIANKEFPRAGTLTIIDAATGLPLA